MTTGVLVTNYNTWNLTSQCIEHCLQYGENAIDKFVVVDDFSTEKFENQFTEIKLIKNASNLGLVRSLNKGLKELDSDLIFIFDSDAWPLEDFVIKTKTYFKDNPGTGLAAFKTEKLNGELSPAFEAEPNAISLLLGQQLYHQYQKYFSGSLTDITIYTCAMVIRKEVLDQIGLFDENYDWLELDHDICMRATRSGWKIGLLPLRAVHIGSGTPQKVSHRVIRFYKNRLKLLRKFNKYPAEKFLNALVVLRLASEYSLFKVLGRFKYEREVLNDKLLCRSELIKLFWNGKI